jgi:hypothetical protein
MSKTPMALRSLLAREGSMTVRLSWIAAAAAGVTGCFTTTLPDGRSFSAKTSDRLERHVVAYQAARDLRCPEDELTAYWLRGPNPWRVRGCGRAARYVCAERQSESDDAFAVKLECRRVE